jgi:hypothetical protein
MKILFGALHFAYFRNFESVVAALAERGHRVHLAADEPEELGGRALVERLAARYPGVTYGFAPSLDAEPWFRLARKLRFGRDYVRMHDEAFLPFRKNRQHAGERAPRFVYRWMSSAAGRSPIGRRTLVRMLAAAERLMPISAASRAFVTEHDPDVVLLASVTAWRAPQLDHLRAARALGRRSGVCVFSWDHLSSKALMRVVPDRVFVWNETQKREAVEWHHMPADRVVVTGAQCYDQWFDRQPARGREEFCRAVGLAPERPFLLYVCSVMSPDPRESAFVLRWIEEIRRSPDPALRDAGILVRPHPERMDEWSGVSLERFGNVALYGRNPVSPDAQADYFDSLYHSHAVIGLVTSAFLEAAVVGRPVHTLTLPEFEIYQDGVQHFRYLVNVEGGLLRVSRSFPEHLDALAGALGRPVARDARNERFVQAFVRPAGLTAAATPAFVQAVEELAAAAPQRADVPGVLHRIAQPLVRHVARAGESGWLRPALRDTREREIDLMEAQKARAKQAAVAEKARWHAEKSRALDARRRERTREHRVRNQQKYVARLKGRLRTLMGLSQ